MSRRALAQSPRQDVCIFCACHLLGAPRATAQRPYLTARRRARFSSTTRNRSQQPTNPPSHNAGDRMQPLATGTRTPLSEREYLAQLSQAIQANTRAASPLTIKRVASDHPGAATRQPTTSHRDNLAPLNKAVSARENSTSSPRIIKHVTQEQGNRPSRIKRIVSKEADRNIRLKESAQIPFSQRQVGKGQPVRDPALHTLKATPSQTPAKSISLPSFLQAREELGSTKASSSAWGSKTAVLNDIEYGDRDDKLNAVEEKDTASASATQYQPIVIRRTHNAQKNVPEIVVPREPSGHKELLSASRTAPLEKPIESMSEASTSFQSQTTPTPKPQTPAFGMRSVYRPRGAQVAPSEELSAETVALDGLQQQQQQQPPVRELADRYTGGLESNPLQVPAPEFDELKYPIVDIPKLDEGASEIDKMFEQYRLKRNARNLERRLQSAQRSQEIKQVPIEQKLEAPPTSDQYTYTPSVSSAPDRDATTPQRDITCRRCGLTGHIARDCTTPPADFVSRYNQDVVCLRCGQPGHIARFCNVVPEKRPSIREVHPAPRREVICQRCGENGHSARDCDTPIGAMSSFDPVDRPDHRAPSTREDNDFVRARDDTATGALRNRDRQDGSDQSSFDEAIQRISSSRRFADVPDRKGRQSRPKRAEENDDEYYGRDEDEDLELSGQRNARRLERQADKERRKREREAAARREEGTKITLPDYISVSNLAQALGVHYDAFIEKLESLGYDDVFPGKILNSETSSMIAMEYGFDPQLLSQEEVDTEKDLVSQPEPAEGDREYLPSRPPVVTIMGHVDHGKTTLLDYLRKASVAAGEAGGITQHIGAFSVTLETTGRTITFLDTPGHAAFLAMRQRGANVTDIVVLVVAADDSVKPQTLEALKHARAANVPIIVAINKVDKPEADVQRVKGDLGRHGIEIEDYGGETQVIEVSGKTGQGMEDLEEAIVTQSEVLDHRADTGGAVEGWVLEATTKASGRVATVLVRRGTLKTGDVLVAGRTWARVRVLRDDNGRVVREALPGMPVEVDGWREQPMAGDEVLEASSEQQASSVVAYRQDVYERRKLAEDTEAINEARLQEQQKRDREASGEKAQNTEEQTSGQIKVPFVIKADVSGSAEAVAAYIEGVATPLIAPQVLYSEVGQVNEGDIEIASVGGGSIISFNLPADEGMKAQAAARGIRILEHNIIYRALDEVKELLQDKLPAIVTQKVIGEADIATSFDIGIGGRKKLKVAGCKVRNGVIGKTSRVRVMRDTTKIYDGAISSLKNVKKDVTEMRKGTECGIAFDGWEDFQAGDVVQTYQEISEKRSLT